MNTPVNQRILLVDDMPAIHDDFRKILAAAPESDLGDDEAMLFGETSRAQTIQFELESAYQGAEAVEKVRGAVCAGAPFAMAFIDMRMPPGWDGVETVERLWQEDPHLQIVICTAYSDYSWTDVLRRLDVRDRLLILKKPFDAIEVFQFASALTMKWTLTKQAAFKMNALEQAVDARTRELADANLIVQNSPVVLYRIRGSLPFPLIYISDNVAKLGHDRASLIGSTNWADVLVHPEDRAKVDAEMARILGPEARGASIEFRMRTADGDFRWAENRYLPVRDEDGRLVEVEGMIIDITERKAAEDRIGLLARTDGLTGLANRAALFERLRQAFASAERGATSFAIFYLDLDGFKQVNDTLGHPIGDLLLCEVADRLRKCTREMDVVARLGGDEFAVLQAEIVEPAGAAALAARLQVSLAMPYHLDGNDIRISASIGICLFDPTSASADAMLVRADAALYRSKSEGRNRYRFHCEELDQQVTDRNALAIDLRTAIDEGQLELFYEPQIDLATNRIVGMEALVRWNHPTRGVLPAAAFVPVAKKTGMILPLGHWILDQACRQMRSWRSDGLPLPAIMLAIAAEQLRDSAVLIGEVSSAIGRWGVAAADLEFGVGEATLGHLLSTHNDVLAQLRELGVKIAIADFGSQYSSFEYVRACGVDHVRIAQSFVDRADDDAHGASVTRAIVNFARDVGIGVIAGGGEPERPASALERAQPSYLSPDRTRGEGMCVARATQLLAAGRRGLGEQAVDLAPVTAAPRVLATLAS